MAAGGREANVESAADHATRRNLVDPHAGPAAAAMDLMDVIKAAAENGWLDGAKAALESVLVIKRAGADGILTYFAPEIARALARGCLS
jgi:hypothetical protein